MNNLDRQHEWISWETSTHYCIASWGGPGTAISVRWVRKDKYIKNEQPR